MGTALHTFIDIFSAAFPVEEEKKPKYDFSRFAGKLKWRGGDPVAYQRSIRDEW